MAEQNNNVIYARTKDGVSYKLERRETLPSVTELAREYALKGYPDKYAVFCERQRKRVSEKEKAPSDPWEYGVFISCILRPSLFPSQAALISPLSTAALVNALEGHTTKRLGISWVSDVYCEGSRIGGVSVEGKLNLYGSYEYIIVSFSVALSEQNFPSRLTDLVRKVFEGENLSVPMLIAKNIMNEFFVAYANLKTPEKLMKQYSEKFILRKNYVRFIKDGKRKRCKVLGVRTDNLALILDDHGTLTEVASPKSVIFPKKIKIID